MTFLRIGKRQINLPRSRSLRILIGVSLIIGGILGFLPVVGFWMIPLGVVVLSAELHLVRRWRRRAVVKWGRSKQRRAGLKSGREKLEEPYYD